MPDFIPGREADLVPYTLNLATRAGELAVPLGLDPAMVTAYAGLQADFTILYNQYQEPGLRTPALRAAKDTMKAELIAKTREIARIVQARPGVTDQQKVLLGLPVHKTEHSSEGVPDFYPELDIISVVGNVVKVRAHGDTPRRGKPAGCYAAAILTHVGATPPTDPAQMKPEGNTTRGEFSIQFPITLPPGTKVWITAAWQNRRLQPGPLCPALPAFLGGGALSQAA